MFLVYPEHLEYLKDLEHLAFLAFLANLHFLEYLAYLVPASESCLDVGGPLSSGHAVNFKMELDDGRYD